MQNKQATRLRCASTDRVAHVTVLPVTKARLLSTHGRGLPVLVKCKPIIIFISDLDLTTHWTLIKYYEAILDQFLENVNVAYNQRIIIATRELGRQKKIPLPFLSPHECAQRQAGKRGQNAKWPRFACHPDQDGRRLM